MTNRKQRRAETAISKPEEPWPSAHGGAEQCGNCHFSMHRETHLEIIDRLAKQMLAFGQPAVQQAPMDETICMYDVRHEAKKVWAWCRHWEKKL